MMPSTLLRLWRGLSGPQLFVSSFAVVVALGTLGLATIPAFYVGGVPLGWVDALFTATSAVCVTGLVLVDTGTHFTLLGQAFILLLIQTGGLGMITLTTLIILTLGRRISLRSESIAGALGDSVPRIDRGRLLRDVVLFTFLLEGIGAALLLPGFLASHPPASALWHAVFHAVSAFCNAGFSTFSNSLEGLAGQPAVLLPIAALVVLGGIGFLTLEELVLYLKERKRGVRRVLSLHSRVVLSVSSILLVAGTLLYALLEWEGVLAGGGMGTRWLGALFMSTTARTAGFNTVDYGEAGNASNFLTLLLMTIGGSPGSTAGGLKTTTLFLIGLLAWSRIRGRPHASVWSRTVPAETVQRAVGLFVVASTMVATAIFLLTILEADWATSDRFLWIVFEAVSAFNTVGLSLGATESLSPGGRLVVIFLMFLGRVGPLAFAAAIAIPSDAAISRIRFGGEDVTVG